MYKQILEIMGDHVCKCGW